MRETEGGERVRGEEDGERGWRESEREGGERGWREREREREEGMILYRLADQASFFDRLVSIHHTSMKHGMSLR